MTNASSVSISFLCLWKRGIFSFIDSKRFKKLIKLSSLCLFLGVSIYFEFNIVRTDDKKEYYK